MTKRKKPRPKCKECGVEISKEIYTYCRKCASKYKDYSFIKRGKDHPMYGKKSAKPFKTGKDNPQYKHGKTLKQHYCIDCGTEICWKAQRCVDCAHIKELHGNWQGGKSFEEYGVEFDNGLKEQIRFRDGYKCQECGCSQLENGRQLDIHHIDYIKKNNKPNNLISLCKSCHMKTNFNRDYYYAYFMYIINADNAIEIKKEG